MDQATHNRIVSFLWGIADDVLRDLFRRGKYPDVILPMCVLRRLDAVLEPTKAKVLETKQKLDAAEIKEQDAALRAAAEQAFYNISPFTLRDLTSRGSEQQLRADFEAWRELPPAVGSALAAAVPDLDDRLRILDALYIPTRYPNSLPDGAPADHFGRLQSNDALRHARSIVDAIAASLA